MEHYQIILAYDGSHFKGFQRQANARTVQGEVESALRKLNWHGMSILAAGRTDTGTHANGQVIAFELEWNHEPQELQQALNNYLPSDVVAREVNRVCASFHPRFDASWRRYMYRIVCQPVREPLLEHYAWRVWPALSENTLHETASLLVGTHDFGAFGTPPQPGGSTIRCVLDAEWKQDEIYHVFEIKAHAFLYHMVRRLVFMQVKIAQGTIDISDLKRALKLEFSNGDLQEMQGNLQKRMVHGLAPAQGLILAEVRYPPEAVRLNEDTV